MNKTLRMVAPTQLGTSVAVLYTAPSNVQITNATVTNSSAAAVTLLVYIVALGASSSAASLVTTVSVPADATLSLSALVGLIMETGETLQASASTASSLTFTATGVLL